MVLKPMVAEQTVPTIQGSYAKTQATTAQTCIRKTSRYHLLTEKLLLVSSE